jgi:hypothetical protein
MRRRWLHTVVLGFLLGPLPSADEIRDVDVTEADSVGVEVEVEVDAAQGHVASGTHFHVWEEDAREGRDWVVELRQADDVSDEAVRWRTVAATSAALTPILTDEIEADLTDSIETSSEIAGLPPLGCILCALSSLDRTCLVSVWATSPDERVRRAVAAALSAPFEAVGVRGAITWLKSDPSAEVRRLARAAEASRRAVLG